MDPKKPDISVIVVCYNQEATIARTLDSILAQRFDGSLEILVSDDRSTDGTAEVARRYAAAHPDTVKVHVNETNLGVQGNYFGAVRRAGADLLADCAGDDWWCDPLKLQKEYDVMSARPDVTLVHTGFYNAFPDGSRRPFEPKSDARRPIVAGKEALLDLLCADDPPLIHLCSALYRRQPVTEALDEDPRTFLDPQWRCEDLQIMAAECAAGDIAYIPDRTLCYSNDAGTISSADTAAKTFDFYFDTTRLRMRLMRKYGVDRLPRCRRAMTRICNFLAAQAFTARSRHRLDALSAWMRKEGVTKSLKTRIRLAAPIAYPLPRKK